MAVPRRHIVQNKISFAKAGRDFGNGRTVRDEKDVLFKPKQVDLCFARCAVQWISVTPFGANT